MHSAGVLFLFLPAAAMGCALANPTDAYCGFSSKKVWIFMITMQNYFTHLPAPFIGDVYSFWLLYSKGNSKRETGTVEFHSLNLVGFWK